MKRWIALLLAAATAFSLTACAAQSTALAPPASAVSQSSTADQVQVDEGLLEVTITLPASYFEEVEDFDPEAYTREQGFSRTVVQEDGTVAITMTRARHNALLNEMKTSIADSLSQLVAAESTPYIQSVSSTEGYGTVTVTVDKAGYEAVLDMTPLLIGIYGVMYQQYAGEEPHCEVTVQDGASGEALTSVVYPDALNG